ncbi:cystinosin [Arapaima gigas]
MSATSLLPALVLPLAALLTCADASLSFSGPSTVQLLQNTSENVTFHSSAPLNNTVFFHFNVTYSSKNVTSIIQLPDEVVLPAETTSNSFEVHAKSVGQATAYLYSNSSGLLG